MLLRKDKKKQFFEKDKSMFIKKNILKKDWMKFVLLFQRLIYALTLYWLN